jgi:ABC-2 type transport system ATP-binding protein
MESVPSSIKAEKLSKRFGSFTAVDEVSFEVGAGEVFGLLGTNGAGKTTLIRMLTTLLRPSSGRAWVAGHDVIKSPSRVRAAIGVIPQALTSDLDMTGRENIDVYGEFYAVPRRERHERAARLLEMVGLKERGGDLVATYSGGMRRRLEIARGLIHSPRVLFLDEPTIGLDPQSRRVVWDLLQGLRKENELTISLTTHYMDEAEQLCDRIAIVDAGRIVALDTPAGLKAMVEGSDQIEVEVGGDAQRVADALNGKSFVRNLTRDGNGKILITTDNGAESIPMIVDETEKSGSKVMSITMHRLSLEDVFIHFTGRTLRDEPAKKASFFNPGLSATSIRR